MKNCRAKSLGRILGLGWLEGRWPLRYRNWCGSAPRKLGKLLCWESCRVRCRCAVDHCDHQLLATCVSRSDGTLQGSTMFLLARSYTSHHIIPPLQFLKCASSQQILSCKTIFGRDDLVDSMGISARNRQMSLFSSRPQNPVKIVLCGCF